MHKIKLHQKQTEAWEYLQDTETEILLYGGQANSGKSILAAIWLLYLCYTHNGIVCLLGRGTLKSLINTSLKSFQEASALLGFIEGRDYKIDLNKKYNIEFYNPVTKSFKGGSEIMLMNLELRPRDLNGDFLGGYNISVAVIEEVTEVPQTYYEAVLSRCGRQPQFNISKLLLTCNPSDNWVKTNFYDRWIKNILPPDIKFVSTVGASNPFRTAKYAKKLNNMSERMLRRLEYGDWEYASCVDQLFGIDKLEEIFTGHMYGIEKDYYISADIARFGQDNTVIILWEGFKIIRILKFNGLRNDEVAQKIREIMDEFKISKNKVIADEIGNGGGVVDILRCYGFNSNQKPFSNQNYENVKAQCYFKMSKIEWSVATNIKEEHKEAIKRELKVIRDVSDDLKLKINSKDKQKQLLSNQSPDYADAIMMRMYYTFTTNKLILDFV